MTAATTARRGARAKDLPFAPKAVAAMTALETMDAIHARLRWGRAMVDTIDAAELMRNESPTGPDGPGLDLFEHIEMFGRVFDEVRQLACHLYDLGDAKQEGKQ